MNESHDDSDAMTAPPPAPPPAVAFVRCAAAWREGSPRSRRRSDQRRL